MAHEDEPLDVAGRAREHVAAAQVHDLTVMTLSLCVSPPAAPGGDRDVVPRPTEVVGVRDDQVRDAKRPPARVRLSLGDVRVGAPLGRH
eukprot:6880229-Alexandrium_andersonii.AAC.1